MKQTKKQIAEREHFRPKVKPSESEKANFLCFFLHFRLLRCTFATEIRQADKKYISAVVYSDSFLSALQLIIDLEDENTGEGNHVLCICAFGK